ncbi:sugar phosphate nucleotidyltransferase [Ammoniphilus sp. YIM 78166]|uniref:sugar phosphate nucleotidyltransferase n=1 Tax=Ammoniphilus sp. YIM 78166 TaxID=1644106 RepID=UPI00142FECFC|nr:sugar phosphate nucleotidyltransferase [Ammoniphilus sp. YIM 78166]
MNRFALILAAGKGTRMKSELPKVMHPIGGKPMVEHLVSKLERIGFDEIIVVVGHKGEMIKEHLGERVGYVEQAVQLGTAHAVRQAEFMLKGKQGATLVLTGDTPLIKKNTMERLLQVQQSSQSAGVVLTAVQENPTGYGRILRDRATGSVMGIVEEKDATAEQKEIQEVNTGIFCFDNESLFEALPRIGQENAQGEYYLTDIIEAMKGKRFDSVTLDDAKEVMGINDREQLAEAEKVFTERAE